MHYAETYQRLRIMYNSILGTFHVTCILGNTYIRKIHCRIMETAPTLPDFALALKPEEYGLPIVDPSWNEENTNNG